VKSFKGSRGNQIGDPIDNLIRNYSYLLNQALKNVAYKKLYNDALNTGVLVSSMVPPKMAKFQKGSENIVIKVKGEDRVFKVDDARLFHALSELDSKALSVPILRLGKKWLTWGVTIAPAFRIRNFIRDTFHTWILMGKISPLDVAKGFKDVLTGHDDFKKMKAVGGGMSGSFYNAESLKSIQHLIDSSVNNTDGSLNVMKLWERVGEASENANRLALFRKLQVEGKSEFEAGFQARDLMDFAAHGSSGICRFLIGITPFLNARLQGLNKIGRELAGPNKTKILL